MHLHSPTVLQQLFPSYARAVGRPDKPLPGSQGGRPGRGAARRGGGQGGPPDPGHPQAAADDPSTGPRDSAAALAAMLTTLALDAARPATADAKDQPAGGNWAAAFLDLP